MGSHLQEPLHLGEGIRVEDYCQPDGDGAIALHLETDCASLMIGLVGHSYHARSSTHQLSADQDHPILVQEAFEGGRVRRSEFVTWWLPLEMEDEDLVVEELVQSEERNTLTGSKDGLVWEVKVPVYHAGSATELVVTWTYKARRVS